MFIDQSPSTAALAQVHVDAGGAYLQPEALEAGRPMKGVNVMHLPIQSGGAWFRLKSGSKIGNALARAVLSMRWITRGQIREVVDQMVSSGVLLPLRGDGDEVLPEGVTVHYSVLEDVACPSYGLSLVTLPDGKQYLRIERDRFERFDEKAGPVFGPGAPIIATCEGSKLFRDYERAILHDLNEFGPVPDSIDHLQYFADISGKYGTAEKTQETLMDMRRFDLSRISDKTLGLAEYRKEVIEKLGEISENTAGSAHNSALSASYQQEGLMIQSGQIDPEGREYARDGVCGYIPDDEGEGDEAA